MSKVAIVTDSTCDMPLPWYPEHGVTMVPLKVRFGDEEFLDWVELDPPAFYARLTKAPMLPKTSQPSPAEFLNAYVRAAADGADEIVSIHLSGSLSGTVESARIASADSPIPVHVIDTKKVTAAIALAVLAACEARDAGKTGTEVAEVAAMVSCSERLFFMLDTLDYLVKGGRAGKATGLAASVLNIKPLLEVNSDGIIEPHKRARGERQAIQALVDTVREDAELLGHLNVGLVHANHPEKADEVAGAIRAARIPATILLTSHVGAVIGTYAGPGAIGVGVLPHGVVVTATTTDRAAALLSWDAPVSSARFVDAARTRALAQLEIETVGDLLRHYPFRYLDLSNVQSLGAVKSGTEATVVGRVHEIREKRPRPRLTITEVAIVDGTGVVLGVWFNQAWVRQRFVMGERVAFAGKIEMDYGLKQIKNPFVEKLGADNEESTHGRVLPIHRTTEGLSTNWLRRLIAAAVDDHADVPDHLPSELRERRGLMRLGSAIRSIHFPNSAEQAAQARRRLAFDELFTLQCYMAMRRHALTREQAGVAHRLDGPALAALKGALPFELTSDQSRAVVEILGDMASPHPMNRLLLGDVGTGKTAVAAHALAAAADSGGQAAMMAPTEVLANQYSRAVGTLLDDAGVSWGLLTGSTPAAERRALLARLADGSLQVVFGTHALLEESVTFDRLTLSVVDEQHRFGVGQRLGLRGKGAAADLLVMTATPIPRSLALTLYGDLETSYLREKPHGRGLDHVSTELIRPQRRDKAYERIRAAIRAGRQAYVVCALVEESDAAEARAANREAERLQRQVFPDLRVALLTGRMKSAEKQRVMADFSACEIDVLVATTVIEVGVDIPNATVMLVEDAERFGLAQLHQLRGRIGRGEHSGEFILLADARTDEGRKRMEAIVATNDGFELAEQDLMLRGEGHILGDRQHGLPEMRLASVLSDRGLIDEARADAMLLIAKDPHLARPQHLPLRRMVRRTFADAWEWVSSG